jgi:hypothetical protein
MAFLDMVNFDREFFVPKILMHICTHQKERTKEKADKVSRKRPFNQFMLVASFRYRG